MIRKRDLFAEGCRHVAAICRDMREMAMCQPEFGECGYGEGCDEYECELRGGHSVIAWGNCIKARYNARRILITC